jgi:hypothetical protein
MSNMTHCPYCNSSLRAPPSLVELHKIFPSISPNRSINRDTMRCKKCDDRNSCAKQREAEFPPPEFINITAKIEQDIQTARILAEEGVRKKELENAIVEMKERLEEEVRKRDEATDTAWEVFYGIWGSRF